MKRFSFPAALWLACACAPALAQSQLVSLNVVATDKQGQPVTDLKAEDFKITDDGKPQSIAMFRINDSRVTAPAAPGPHVYSNRAAGASTGATVILFDLLNGSFTDREYMVLTLVKALGSLESPGNVFLYLITNNGTLFPIHPLPEPGADATPDPNWAAQAKALLDSAIQKVYGIRQVDDQDVGIRAVKSFNLLRSMGGQLSVLPGRKNLVWITNGFPIQIDYGGRCHDIRVWPNVTAPCSGNFVDLTPVVRYLGGELDSVGVSIYPVDEWNVDGGERVMVKQTLDTFADLTGGKSYASGGAKEAIPDAVRATKWSYTIAYAPKTWDGKYHKVRVTTDRKGVQIQSEMGYTATAPADRVGSLLQAGAINKTDLGSVGLHATISPGPAPHTTHVQLRIDAGSLTMVQQNGHYVGQFALLYAGVAADGVKQLAKPSTLTLDWTQQQYDNAVKTGLPLNEDVPTPEGVSQLRIVVVDMKSNQVGSLVVPLS